MCRPSTAKMLSLSLALICWMVLSSMDIVVAFSVVPWNLRLTPLVPLSTPPTSRVYTNTALSAAKKKSSATTPTSKKVQVKLLQHVAGTGQAGDIVMVAPAYYHNKLRPIQAAIAITDEQVAQERAQAAQTAAEDRRQALAVREMLEQDDCVVYFRRKAGPNGHLFGGIHYKQLAETIQTVLPTPESRAWFEQRTAKFTGIVNAEGQPLPSADIKHVGTYTATLVLLQDIQAKVSIHVEADA
jgi:ribosomal protein L9